MANDPAKPNAPASHTHDNQAAPIRQPSRADQGPEDRPGNPLNQHQGDGKVPSEQPSFSSLKDEPLATAGIVGSDDPKGRVRPGGGEVPADSPDDDDKTESGYLKHPDRTPGAAKGNGTA